MIRRHSNKKQTIVEKYKKVKNRKLWVVREIKEKGKRRRIIRIVKGLLLKDYCQRIIVKKDYW